MDWNKIVMYGGILAVMLYGIWDTRPKKYNVITSTQPRPGWKEL